ncbi:GNAT family N-acetyltransferase [Streptomyces chryseus]
MTTERVRGSHHLLIQDGERRHRMSFHQVHDSPLWRARELDAGVTQPTWDGAILYAPSVYGGYGGLPGATPPVLSEAVDRGRTLARNLGSEALVIANLPPAERTLWREARTPDAEVVLSWSHRTRVRSSVDEFTANLPSNGTGRELIRKHQQGTQGGLTLRVAQGAQLLPYLTRLTALTSTAGEALGPVLYGTDMFALLTRVPGAVGLLAEHTDGSIAGALLCFRYGSCLYLWSAVIDQARAHDVHTHSWLTLESFKYAVATGASVIDAGQCDYAPMAGLGLMPVALTSLIYLTRPNPHLISRLGALHTGLNRSALRDWSKD